MEQQAIRVIASDIGGTLAGSDGRVSERSARTIRRLLQVGVHFMLVSGYNLNIVKPMLDFICPEGHPRLSAIVQNGALLIVGGETVEMNWLPLQRAKDAIAFFLGKGFSPIAFGGPGLDWRTYAQPLEKGREVIPGRRIDLVDNLAGFLSSDPVQISVYDETERIMELEPEARRLFGGDCHVVLSVGSERSWLEINHRRANKLTAFNTVLRRLGLTPAQAMYFGDNLNDLELIQAVAYPVVMQNGLAKLKESAWRIAPSNDQDGVAQVIEEIMGFAAHGDRPSADNSAATF